MLNMRVARVAISSALASDVLVLLALGVVIAMATSQRDAELFTVSLAVIKLGVLLLVVALCYVVCARLPSSRMRQRGVAIVMNARGVMEMAVASIAFRAGLVDAKLFSALLVRRIVTTTITPVLLKRWCEARASRRLPNGGFG